MGIKPAANIRRVQFDPSQFSRFPRPVELVFLVTMEQIIFSCTAFEGSANRKPHHHQPHTLFCELTVESGLVKVKRSTILQAVECGGWAVLDPDRQKPQPACFSGELNEFMVKGGDLRILESFGYTALSMP